MFTTSYYIVIYYIWIVLNKLDLLYIVCETWTTVRVNMIDRPVDVRKFVLLKYLCMNIYGHSLHVRKH